MNEETIEAAMQIILHAGDARLICREAMQCMATQDFKAANIKMKEARKKITLAHKIQTDAIQKEINDCISEYSLLFTHAQDTLMTIFSELNLTEGFMNILSIYAQKIKDLENRIH